MSNFNQNNERIKRRYFAYLQEAQRYSVSTVDAVAKSLARFEADNKFKDFRAFHFEQAIAFKRRLVERPSDRTGAKLSKATAHATLANLKRFFHWLAGQPGYKSRLQYSDADYFNLSEKDVRIATSRREQRVPTLEQIHHVLAQMPIDDEVQLRNRALVAFILLSGARDSAIASMKVKHVDLIQLAVFQDAREVNTKFSKSFKSTFFPVGGEALAIVSHWLTFLRETKLLDGEAPLFPSVHIGMSTEQQFEVTGLSATGWKSAGPIRKILRDAFEAAGLPYFPPHSFRHTLVKLGETLCKTPEEFKAWSQNMGHEGVLTTFVSYGTVSGSRQNELLRSMAVPSGESTTEMDIRVQAALLRLVDRIPPSTT